MIPGLVESTEPIDFEAYRRAKQERKRIEDEWLIKRAKLYAECEKDPKYKAAVLIQCNHDPLFWFDYFAWTYDPRELPQDRVKPLILYDYQRELVLWLWKLLESTLGTLELVNALIEKSRDMGASWVVFLFVLWYCWFHNGSFLIISRKEEEVDKRGDLDTPFEKLRFCLRQVETRFSWLLPKGFTWRDHDRNLLLQNPVGGAITGESANQDAGRGGRQTGVIWDEFGHIENDTASWEASGGTTNFRLALGTPNGPHNKYAHLAAQKKGEEFCHIKRLHWSIHPLKSAGMTRDKAGKLTSPWYEKQKANKNDEEIARELDISYEKSTKGVIFGAYGLQHQVRGLQPIPDKVIIRAWDPGVNFHVSFIQVDNYQRVLVLRDLHRTSAHIADIGAEVLEISQEYKSKYRNTRFVDCGDPAGAVRQSSSAEVPEYDTLRDKYGIDVDYLLFQEMPTRLRQRTRINAIINRLTTFNGQLGTPCLLVDMDHCRDTHEALESKYRRKVDKRTKEVLDEIDEQHPWEDAIDCLGYAIIFKLGALGNKKESKHDPDNIVDMESFQWDGGLTTRRKYVV